LEVLDPSISIMLYVTQFRSSAANKLLEKIFCFCFNFEFTIDANEY